MGKEVEGKGRMKQLERDDQHEEARGLLNSALALRPPSVYRASCLLYTSPSPRD